MALSVQIELVGFMNIVKGYHCPVSWSYDGVQAEWSGWSAFISDPACSLELCEDHQLRGADNVLTRSVLGSLVSRLSTIFIVQHSSSDFFIAAVMHSVWWMSLNAARHSASPFKLYVLIWQSPDWCLLSLFAVEISPMSLMSLAGIDWSDTPPLVGIWCPVEAVIYNVTAGREFIQLKVNKLTYNGITDMFIILPVRQMVQIVINQTPSLSILSPYRRSEIIIT